MAERPNEPVVLQEGQWLYVTHRESKAKTEVYGVYNNPSNNFLGEIRWYGPWRKYVFAPADSCVFDQGCLKSLDKCLGWANRRHKELSSQWPNKKPNEITGAKECP
jgi:hypothetical protein